jgi:hypothetical protein
LVRALAVVQKSGGASLSSVRLCWGSFLQQSAVGSIAVTSDRAESVRVAGKKIPAYWAAFLLLARAGGGSKLDERFKLETVTRKQASSLALILPGCGSGATAA